MRSAPPRSRRSRRAAAAAPLVTALAAVLAGAVPAAAQVCPPNQPCEGEPVGHDTDLRGHALVLGVNTAVGALTAGLREHARGGSFRRGLVTGAAGGAAMYGGKWLSAEPYWGAGLAGRQVAAVGASVVRNASEGRAPFSQLLLPAGPVRILVSPDDLPGAQVRLDLVGAAVFGWHLASRETRLDPGSSLSAGTPVFWTELARQPGWHGNNTAGVILLHDRPAGAPATPFTRETVFAHERIHLLQYDFALHAWSAPFEARLLRRVPGGATIARHVDLGLIIVPLALLNRVIEYDDRPWEREAHFFSGSGVAHRHPMTPGI
jgi:hypothetical protein